MKSDDEIKEWIDSREAVTQRELNVFIYGYTGVAFGRVAKWWDYVLTTKDWDKLKKHKEQRINNGQRDTAKFNKVKAIYNKDERLQNCGYKTFRKYLQNIYNIDIALGTSRVYLKTLKQ